MGKRHIEDVKRGFYYLNNEYSERCYFLSGDKKGNKWIDIAGINGIEKVPMPDPQWTTLIWTCIPKENELSECSFHEENPTIFNIF